MSASAIPVSAKRIARDLQVHVAALSHTHQRPRELDSVLRSVDCAWRSSAADAELLAPIYARLLCFDFQYAASALRLLQRADQERCDPDLAALSILANFALQDFDAARDAISAAIADYCVLAEGLLAHVIARYGALLDMHCMVPATVSDFSSRPIDQAYPTDFRVDGRATQYRKVVNGWARIGWLPTQRVQLCLMDETGAAHSLRTARMPRSNARWLFNVDLKSTPLRGSRINIFAKLPDGRRQALGDSPLLLTDAVRLPISVDLPRAWSSANNSNEKSYSKRINSKQKRAAARVDVIIPVYRGGEETLACIHDVIATVDRDVQVIVIDDASDDSVLVSALDELAASQRITLLRHASNQGFVRSVNDGLAVNPLHDAVLLNADTRVFGNWLERLRAAAYAERKTGTVTPFSNAASIVSYPRPPGKAMAVADAAELDGLVKVMHAGVTSALPVGVGFCLYLRRECLREIGVFDAAVFGRGYGEEVDFCLRARARGWSHRLAADVYVYHAGGRSFGAARAALLDRSQRLLEQRHRGYAGWIASFAAQEPLLHLRRAMDERRLASLNKPCVLIVTLALTGGVDRFVADRCRALPAQGRVPIVLRALLPDSLPRSLSRRSTPSQCTLWTDALDVPNLIYDTRTELTALRAVLRQLKIESIELQHFLHLDPSVIELVRELGMPYDVFVHDYAWICPRVTLLDHRGRYCGEPELKDCERCARHEKTPLGENISVRTLRARSERWLSTARRVIAPSQDTAHRLQRYFPVLSVDVQPHTIMSAPIILPRRTRAPHTVRVSLIGAIGTHKGYQVLHACARDARRRCLPLEFVVIGYTHDDEPLRRTGKVFVTGRYTDGEVPHLLRREQPDVMFLASMWPETWCYALDHALASTLPVVAFDLGAIAERLRNAEIKTVLLPLGTSVSQINNQMLRLARHPKTAHYQQATTMGGE